MKVLKKIDLIKKIRYIKQKKFFFILKEVIISNVFKSFMIFEFIDIIKKYFLFQ